MRQIIRHPLTPRDLQKSSIILKRVCIVRRERIVFSLKAVKALLLAISRRGIKERNYLWHNATIKNPGIEFPGYRGHWSVPISIPWDYETVNCHRPGSASISGEYRRYGGLGWFNIHHADYVPGRVLRVAYLVDQALVLTTQGLFLMVHKFSASFGYRALYRVILRPQKPVYHCRATFFWVSRILKSDMAFTQFRLPRIRAPVCKPRCPAFCLGASMVALSCLAAGAGVDPPCLWMVSTPVSGRLLSGYW